MLFVVCAMLGFTAQRVPVRLPALSLDTTALLKYRLLFHAALKITVLLVHSVRQCVSLDIIAQLARHRYRAVLGATVQGLTQHQFRVQLAVVAPLDRQSLYSALLGIFLLLEPVCAQRVL